MEKKKKKGLAVSSECYSSRNLCFKTPFCKIRKEYMLYIKKIEVFCKPNSQLLFYISLVYNRDNRLNFVKL